MASSEVILEAVPSVGDVSAEEWDACANPPGRTRGDNGGGLPSPERAGAGAKPYYNPFVSHAFFSSAESSGSATPRTGWAPRHLLARRDGRIAGIVPCYLKSHSQGEYVFDRGWADAYERA